MFQQQLHGKANQRALGRALETLRSRALRFHLGRSQTVAYDVSGGPVLCMWEESYLPSEPRGLQSNIPKSMQQHIYTRTGTAGGYGSCPMVTRHRPRRECYTDDRTVTFSHVVKTGTALTARSISDGRRGREMTEAQRVRLHLCGQHGTKLIKQTRV